MASLPTRVLASFQAGIPVPTLNDLDGEFNQLVGAAGFLNGNTTGKKLLVKTSDASDPPVDCDQIGAGPLARFKQNGTLKVSIANTGQVVSAVTTGTAPFSVASTTVVTNLNADTVGGIASSNIAKLDTHKTAFAFTWFYVALPGAVETTESVNRFVVPPGVEITITRLAVVWAANVSSNASNIFTIKRRNSAGTLQTDIGTIDVNQAALGNAGKNVTQVNNITDVPLTADDQIYPLFTTRNTGAEQLVSIVAHGTQKLTT